MPLLQNLPPEQAHLCLGIEKRIKRTLLPLKNKHLLLAISGGADSVALALVFNVLAPRLSLRLSAMHINHSIRPSADEDAAFVSKLCARLAIPHAISKINVPARALRDNCGLEEAGRAARYEALEQHGLSINADYILTGHHAGDLAEDIIMRFLRGAAWPALGGMAWQRGRILHPILHESPSALRKFVTACGFTWKEDESNKNLGFLRNRIRHILMPMLHCENPAMEDTCLKMHDQATLDDDYWQMEISRALYAHPWHFIPGDRPVLILDKQLLSPMHPALRMRFFNFALNWLREKTGARGQNSSDALTKIEELFKKSTSGKKIECSGGIHTVCKSGNMHFIYVSPSRAKQPRPCQTD